MLDSCQNLGTLLARLLKSRYYPNYNLLQAVIIGGSSYIWSSIWEAKENMKGGLRWVIGDGKTINIQVDRWLRGKDNFYVDPGGSCNPDLKVCDFFLTGKKE